MKNSAPAVAIFVPRTGQCGAQGFGFEQPQMKGASPSGRRDNMGMLGWLGESGGQKADRRIICLDGSIIPSRQSLLDLPTLLWGRKVAACRKCRTWKC